MKAQVFFIDFKRGETRNWEPWGAMPFMNAFEAGCLPADDSQMVVFVHITDFTERIVSSSDQGRLRALFSSRHPPVIVVSGGKVHQADEDSIRGVFPGENVHVYRHQLDIRLTPKDLDAHFGSFIRQPVAQRFNFDALYTRLDLLTAFRLLLQTYVLALTPVEEWPQKWRAFADGSLKPLRSCDQKTLGPAFWSPVLEDGRIHQGLLLERHKKIDPDLYAQAEMLKNWSDWDRVPANIIRSYRDFWFEQICQPSAKSEHT